MNYRVEIPAFAAILALGAGVLHLDFRSQRAKDVSRLYDQAIIGQPESLFLAELGAPDQALPCGEFLWWDGDTANPRKNDGRCVKWVRYNFFLSAYGFGFSQDGKLVSRYNYISE